LDPHTFFWKIASSIFNVDPMSPQELAHQWFGNLVTMQWWDDLWRLGGAATTQQRSCDLPQVNCVAL
jgi:aminopeptidase N